VDTARYAELFLTESREHLSAINHALLDLERSARTSEGDGAASDAAREVERGAVAALFRAVHTVKGMSATMGYTGVASLSHEMEALLDRVRQGELTVQAALMDALFTAADALESSIERAVAGRPDDRTVEGIAARLRALAAPAAAVGRGRSAKPPSPTARSADRRGSSRRTKAQTKRGRRGGRGGGRRADDDSRPSAPGLLIVVTIAPDAQLRGVRAAMVIQKARDLGQVTAVDPAEDGLLADDFGHELTLRLVTTASPAVITSALRAVGDVTSVTVTSGAEAGAESGTEAGTEAGANRGKRGGLQASSPESGGAGSGETMARTRRSGVSGRLAADGTPGVASALTGADGRAASGGGSGDGIGASTGQRRRRSAGTSIAGEGSVGDGADGFHRARHVRIDLRRLDALMNLIGELVIARGRLVELTTALGDPALVETVGHASRLIGDLQDEIMTCRMVPVWQVFDRFPRLVRDAARSLGKQVAFEVDGKEIELDRSMLDEIGEPIVHLLRNAVDHGIEAPDVRVAAGKPAEGRLTLSATRDRSAVLIRVMDDGRGIDRDRVLARARETGLVDSATTALTDDEVIRLIARPGFTTAERVTDLSGRGVGIDAVQTRVRALGGSVDIKSSPGQGTMVTARLPLTLAIMRALLARVGDETYAFPMAHVDETVATEGAAMAAVRGQPVMVLRGEAIPYVRMRALLPLAGAPAPDGPEGWTEQHVLVVEAAGRRAAVAVDELTGQQDIVVKQFDGVRGGISLFSGATILGDGAPALIVDVSSLF
jgi:two-component system, chemotaxis family, sensor kinase CheA